MGKGLNKDTAKSLERTLNELLLKNEKRKSALRKMSKILTEEREILNRKKHEPN